MITFLAFASIIALTAFAFIIRRLARLPLCPICAGVAGTWAWLLAGSWLGYSVDPALPALLMGGSVVGITYQLERRIRPRRSPLLMKTAFISFGFLAAYALLARSWPMGLAAVVGIIAASAFFLSPPWAGPRKMRWFPSRTTPGEHGHRLRRDPANGGGAREQLVKELEQCC